MMTDFRLFDFLGSYKRIVLQNHLCFAVWISLCIVAIIWPGTASSDSSSITPFSLMNQSSQFNREELREIFFGRRTRWKDGSPVRVYVLPDNHPAHIRFAKEILGIYPYQLRSAWDRMIFSGTGSPPIVVESLEQMQAHVNQTPGAIGYLER